MHRFAHCWDGGTAGIRTDEVRLPNRLPIKQGIDIKQHSSHLLDRQPGHVINTLLDFTAGLRWRVEAKRGKKKLCAQQFFSPNFVFLLRQSRWKLGGGSSTRLFTSGTWSSFHVGLPEGTQKQTRSLSDHVSGLKKYPKNQKTNSDSPSVRESMTIIYQLIHLSPSQRSAALLAAWPGCELSHSSKTRSSSLCNLSCWELTVKGHPLPSP